MTAIEVLPSILDLGCHYRAIADAWNQIDEAKIAGDADAADIRHCAEDLWLERYAAIVDLILTMPAVTLADAAVQLQAALAWLDGEYADEWPQEAQTLVRRLRRILVSTALVTSRAADVSPAMMGFPSLAKKHRGEFPPALLDGGRAALQPTPDPPVADTRDAGVIALCGQIVDGVTRMEALFSVRKTFDDEHRTQDQMDALFDERFEIIDQLQAAPRVQTDRGRDALVRAALAVVERDRAGEVVSRSKGESLAWLVVKSLSPPA